MSTSKDSPFIIVTHNKRTMASTNVMYGVTMENTGISKVLPVDLVALNLAEKAWGIDDLEGQMPIFAH